MKPYHFLFRTFLTLLFSFVITAQLTAQFRPGYINRPATALSGRQVLDPDLNDYTSQSTSGFGAPSDVATSEIPYKIVQSYSQEPFGDLRRGPDNAYSDFVPDGGNDGFYTYFDGNNLLFRFRIGSIMPGSKGYSILLDTDGRFGATGASADPNFQPATTGTNGNPGFEIEIVLETNFRIAVYNVDGTSSPVLVTSYTNWQDMSQVSLAATNDNGDPDFFMDFYIPFSVLQAAPFNLTTSSSIRMIPTTVMSPQAAIGGPKSDIYGLSDNSYSNTNTQYETFIGTQPPVIFTGIGSGGSGFGSMCTQAPVVNAPIGTGTVNISGTWTASTLTGAATTATITVYRNGSSIGTVSNVSSGSTWTLTGVAAADGDVFSARAQAAGESMCLLSNSVAAQGCNTSNIPSATGLTISCISNRGLEGTFPGTNTVKVYFISSGLVTSTLAGPAANSPTFGYNGANWFYNGTNFNGSQIPSACSGGAPDMTNGTYYVTTIASGSSCESAPVFTCLGLTQTTTPVITQSVLYTNNTTVSGTAVAGATVYLWINGQQRATTVATGGNYSFSGLVLNLNDVVEVRAITSGNCMSNGVSRTVVCFTNPPLINADANNQIAAGQPITGTSSEPAGTTIRVFNATGPVLVATTTVQFGGTWTTASVPFNAVAGTTYYATAQNGSCAVSANSSNVSAANPTSPARCGSITGPVAPGDASVSGTLGTAVAGTTVRLYLDGVLIGSTTTSNTSWTVSGIASTAIYSNGILTIGVQETSSMEVACSASVIVTCSPAPAEPVFTPTNTTIMASQTVTYTITNAVAGTFYAIANSVTGESLGTGVWATANGNLQLTTNPVASPGSYNIVIRATSLSGVTVCTATPAAASLTVNGFTLPVVLSKLTGNWIGEGVMLKWTTESEQQTSEFVIERSKDGQQYTSIGSVKAAGNSNARIHYQFADRSPAAGTNYYRLRMVDADQRFTHSNVLVMRTDASRQVRVWPNPFDNEFTVSYYAKTRATVEMSITDVSGRLIYRNRFTVEPGLNQLRAVNLQQLPRGTYQVEVREGTERTTWKTYKN